MEVPAGLEVKAALVRKVDEVGKVGKALIVLVIKAAREQAARVVQVARQGQEDLAPTAAREVVAETARTLPSAIPKTMTRPR